MRFKRFNNSCEWLRPVLQTCVCSIVTTRHTSVTPVLLLVCAHLCERLCVCVCVRVVRRRCIYTVRTCIKAIMIYITFYYSLSLLRDSSITHIRYTHTHTHNHPHTRTPTHTNTGMYVYRRVLVYTSVCTAIHRCTMSVSVSVRVCVGIVVYPLHCCPLLC